MARAVSSGEVLAAMVARASSAASVVPASRLMVPNWSIRNVRSVGASSSVPPSPTRNPWPVSAFSPPARNCRTAASGDLGRGVRRGRFAQGVEGRLSCWRSADRATPPERRRSSARVRATAGSVAGVAAAGADSFCVVADVPVFDPDDLSIRAGENLTATSPNAFAPRDGESPACPESGPVRPPTKEWRSG